MIKVKNHQTPPTIRPDKDLHRGNGNGKGEGKRCIGDKEREEKGERKTISQQSVPSRD